MGLATFYSAGQGLIHDGEARESQYSRLAHNTML